MSKVLIACEESQTVCKAFREKGYEAYSCDLQPCSGGHPEWHIQEDAIRVLQREKWDLVIAHPPCTRLANSGVRWLHERNLWEELHEAVLFFKEFVKYGQQGNKIAIENPIPHKYALTEIGVRYRQIVQPYHFGHMESKATCLWLFGLPDLQPTNNVKAEMMKLDYKDRAKVHYCSPGPERVKIRSRTYPGIAREMAEQWSHLI